MGEVEGRQSAAEGCRLQPVEMRGVVTFISPGWNCPWGWSSRLRYCTGTWGSSYGGAYFGVGLGGWIPVTYINYIHL